jgi:hypothetical protein
LIISALLRGNNFPIAAKPKKRHNQTHLLRFQNKLLTDVRIYQNAGNSIISASNAERLARKHQSNQIVPFFASAVLMALQ